MENRVLSQQDREFFGLVSQAVFANPFGPERDRIDREISGQYTPGDRGKVISFAVEQIGQRLAKLDSEQYLRIEQFKGPLRNIIEHVVLFDVFHSYAEAFDRHIQRQLKAGDEPVGLDFAGQIKRSLTARGFCDADAIKYIAMFFQIRRAYHFIEKGLTGQSDSMQRLRMNLWNNIFTCDIVQYEKYLWDRMEDFSTLLLGPTGSGKGAAAAAIGQSGFIGFDEKKSRFVQVFTKIFVPVNLSQFAESILESELFGHAKGAFTGAVGDHTGLFAMCSKYGSVFLDEIGDVSEPIQIKLLQILQQRTFSPVGSHERLRFAGRVIAATNKSVDELRAAGRFRDDFYYRLCSDCIEVPALSKRISENHGELEELVKHTVRYITGQESDGLAGTVMEVIEKNLGRAYGWPGNVRELEQCVRRIIIKRDYSGQTIRRHDFESGFKDQIASCSLSADELVRKYCRLIYDRTGTYEETAKRTGLDRRTVKKYVESTPADQT